MKLPQPLRKICIYFSHKDFSKPLLCDTAICNRLFQISLYFQCSSRKDFEDHFWIRLSCPSLPCCEVTELKEVVSCAEGLLWADLAPGGRTNLKALPGSFTYTALIQAPSIPQISADSREVFLPACTNSSTTQEKSSPASAARAGGGRRESAGKGRTHLESIGECWMPWKELQSWQEP